MATYVLSSEAVPSSHGARRRTRTEIFVRRVLRRNTCLIITSVHCAIVALHCVVFVGLYLHMLQLKREMEQRRLEGAINERARKYYNISTFQHCEYLSGKNFVKNYCQDRCGKMAFIYRHRRLKPRFSDPTCLDQNEQVSCFDEENVCKAEIENSAFTPCAGLRTTALQRGSLISAERHVMVPLIDLHGYMNRTLLSQKIVGLCPRCYYRGTPLIRKKACYYRVRTQRHGWPLEFKICDNEIKVDREECET